MNCLKTFFLALTLAFSLSPVLLAQDAAAPIRRASPTPERPVPTPLGKEDPSTPLPTATPKPSPTASRLQEVPRSSDGMALPIPPEPTHTPRAIQPVPAATRTPASIPAPPRVRETPAPPPSTPAREESTPSPLPSTPTPLPSTPPPAPTPAEVKETPAPPPTPTPAAAEPSSSLSPPPSPSEKPVAAPKKKTKAQAAGTPARKVRQEEPVRAVEPRPASSRRPRPRDESDNIGGSRPTFDLSTRGDRDIAAVVKRMENRWQAAIRSHDVSALSALLDDNFVGTSSTGRVGSKSTLLSALRRDKNTYTSVEARGMSVRTSGDDTAVVTGVTREAGTTPDGKRFKTARRFTDTWVKRKGKWRCIASQTTDL